MRCTTCAAAARLSGSDFLPLAVKLDQLYGQFALLKIADVSAPAARVRPRPRRPAPSMTANGTQVIESPKFTADAARPRPCPARSSPRPPAASRTRLRALTDHVAQEHNKTVTLRASRPALVPPAYQSAIKNVAIQLIRNAVMHGIEPPAARVIAGKAPRRHHAARVQERRRTAASSCCSRMTAADSIPSKCAPPPSRAAFSRGEDAARLRDRESIKLIFKSGYSTLANTPGEPAHGTGLSLVRRYVHEAGGKIALASLLGHETRFKVTLPPLAAAAPALELAG